MSDDKKKSDLDLVSCLIGSLCLNEGDDLNSTSEKTEARFIEIDLGEGDVLDLVDGDVVIHHEWDRVKPLRSGSKGCEARKNDNRVAERYATGRVRLWVKPVGLFDFEGLKRACLFDVSEGGVCFASNAVFKMGQELLLRLVFVDGKAFDMEGVVIRGEKADSAGSRFLSGIQLNGVSQSFRDHVLKEGVHSKLR